jgi:oligosaccharide repeat unit polymerase
MNLLMGAMLLGLMLLFSLESRGFYSPSSLMLGLWFFEFTAQYWFGFYEIELKTVLLLVLFITFYVIGAFIGSSIKFKKSNYEWSENKIYNAIKLTFMLLVIVAPFLYLDIRNNVDFAVNNIAQSVRKYYVDSFGAGHVPLTIKIMANFSIILGVLSCIRSNIKLFKKIFFFVCGVLGATISCGKGYLVLMLGYVLSAIIFQSKRRKLYLMVIILSAFSILTLSAVVRDKININKYYRIYLLSSVPAFQMIVNGDFHFPFPTLFGFMKPVFELFGMNIEVPGGGGNFVEVPDSTNVFTAFGPALSDYGILFTVVYFMINGFISGIVYKLAKSSYMIFKIMYGFVLFAIATSIFSDAFAAWSTIFNYLLVFSIINYYARTKIKKRINATICDDSPCRSDD